MASIAQQVVDGTFVDVRASLARTVHLVARVADAAVSAQQVLAGSVGANVGVLSAFVDVCQTKLQ